MQALTSNRILLLEDHLDAQHWLADAIRMAFGEAVSIDITASVEDAKAMAAACSYGLVVADLHVPDGSGIELIFQIKQTTATCPCIVATIYSDDQHLFPALQAGADGFLLKDEGCEEIAAMLAGVLEDRPPISAAIATKILAHFHDTQSQREDCSLALTRREKEILIYLAKGMSTKECAGLMGVGYHTASEYVKNVYRKLGVHSRAEAVLEAVRMGIT